MERGYLFALVFVLILFFLLFFPDLMILFGERYLLLIFGVLLNICVLSKNIKILYVVSRIWTVT